MAPEDALSVIRCADAHLRILNPKTGRHEVRVRQCRSFWCAWCTRRAHARRARYQYRKLQSIQPKDADSVRLLHLVVELPEPLHALVRRDKACMEAWARAIRRTIAHAYGYKGRHSANLERACWSEMGAIFNFHAIGDEGTPWPRYFPHYDILLSAYRRKDNEIVPLRTRWPQKFDATRARYRNEIRRAFQPIATEGMHASAELRVFLATEFDVIWHVGRVPKGAGVGDVHIRSAAHRVRYSCRPLFGLDHCRLESGDEGKDLLVYEPNPHARKRITHRSPPGPAFAALRDMKEQLHGRYSRKLVGILSGEAYKRAVKLVGRDEVHEQEKSGKKLVEAYVRDGEGHWIGIDPRDLRRY